MRKMTAMVVVSWLAMGCATSGWPYEAVTSKDVAEWMAEEGDEEQRELLLRLAGDRVGRPILAYPQPCHRKECAGPIATHNHLLAQAALLLATTMELSRFSDQAMADPDFAQRFEGVVALIHHRLPELRAEIRDVSDRLATIDADRSWHEGSEVARTRLRDAARMADRLERQLRDL